MFCELHLYITIVYVHLHWQWQNFDETAYNVKPPTQMLRFIDALRYHKPTPEESETLNLSSATERIYLHVLNDVRGRDANGSERVKEYLIVVAVW